MACPREEATESRSRTKGQPTYLFAFRFNGMSYTQCMNHES